MKKGHRRTVLEGVDQFDGHLAGEIKGCHPDRTGTTSKSHNAEDIGVGRELRAGGEEGGARSTHIIGEKDSGDGREDGAGICGFWRARQVGGSVVATFTETIGGKSGGKKEAAARDTDDGAKGADKMASAQGEGGPVPRGEGRAVNEKGGGTSTVKGEGSCAEQIRSRGRRGRQVFLQKVRGIQGIHWIPPEE